KIAPSLSDAKGREYVEFIERSVREMDRLVRDLMDVSSMESGGFAVQRKPIELRPVLEEARQRFEMSARAQKITLDCEVDPAARSVNADRGRLLQVISNLLGNAFRFTPEGGRVTLRARRRGNDVEIVV